MRVELREIVAAHGKLSAGMAALRDDADLFEAGMDSLAVVDVMLAIEYRFGVEFPDSMLNRRSFATIAGLEAAVESMLRAVAA